MFNIKNLTKKIKNKKLKGNISLLVILVLLATSVITLLSINQITRLISYGNQTFNYFRAYYLAKAGTELGLAEVYNREDGFNHEVLSGSDIVSGNLVGNFAGFNPYFNMTISGSFETLTNDVRNSKCEGNKISLSTGAGIMLSLFYDKTTGIHNILSGGTNENKIEKLNSDKINNLVLNGNGPKKLTFALFTYKKDNDIGDYLMDDIVVETDKSANDLNVFLNSTGTATLINDTNKKYLTIKNSGTGNEVIDFCISIDDNSKTQIPYSNSLITTIGHYGDTEVGIQSIVKKGVPDWALNVIYQ